jgi:hypothetical protein
MVTSWAGFSFFLQLKFLVGLHSKKVSVAVGHLETQSRFDWISR